MCYDNFKGFRNESSASTPNQVRLYYFPRPSVTRARAFISHERPAPRPCTSARVWKRARSIDGGTAKVTLTFSPTALNIPSLAHGAYELHRRSRDKKEPTTRLAEQNFHKGERERRNCTTSRCLRLIATLAPLYRRNFPPVVDRKREITRVLNGSEKARGSRER